jgi:hypothetical protein
LFVARLAYAAVALSLVAAAADAETVAATPADPVPAPAAGDATAAVQPPPSLPATAVVPAPAPPPVTLVAKIDLSTQRMTVLVRGKPVHTFTISSGAQGYATPTGKFQPGWMAKLWHSRQYDDAPMPHAVFFKDGAAIHATQSIGNLGRPASHGCVRLSPANAETFYKLVARHSLAQTRVHVFGTPNYPAPNVAQRTPPRPVAGITHASAYQPYPTGRFNDGGSWFGGAAYKPSGLGQPPRTVQVVVRPAPVRYVVSRPGYASSAPYAVRLR